MKNSVIKRVWAWIMVACMLFTMAPAFAEGPEIIEEPAPTTEVTEPEAEVTEPAGDEVVSDEVVDVPVEGDPESEPADETEAVEPEETPVAPAEPVADDTVLTAANDAVAPVADNPTPMPTPDGKLVCPGSKDKKHELADPEHATVLQQANCTLGLQKEGMCKYCYNIVIIDFGQKHNWQKTEDSIDATCCNPGKIIWHCDLCDQDSDDQDVNLSAEDATTHVTLRNIPATGLHTYVPVKDKITKEPTCTEPGECTEVYCSQPCCMENGKPKADKIWDKTNSNGNGQLNASAFVIDPIGHDPETSEVPADCVHWASTVTTCKRCHKELNRVEHKDQGAAPDGKHVFDKYVSTSDLPNVGNKEDPDTFTSDYHFHNRVCSRCGAVDDSFDATTAGKCTYVLTSVTESDCKTKGVKTWTCTYCGHERTVTADSLGDHDISARIWLKNDKKTVADCTNTVPGELGYLKCTVCGKAIDQGGVAYDPNGTATSGNRYVIQNAHKWKDISEAVVIRPATCTQDGEGTLYCAREGCTGSKPVTLPATGHKFELKKYKEKEDGTCADPTILEWVCTNPGCTEKRGKQTIPGTACVADMSSDSFEVVRDATCYLEGLAKFPCKNCGHMTEVKLPKLNHSWIEVTHLENCDYKINGEDGVKTVKLCTVCGDMQGDIVSRGSSAHKWTYTDNGDGTHTKVCSVCARKVSEACNSSASGTQAGDCKHEGYSYTACSLCGHEQTKTNIGKKDNTKHVGDISYNPGAKEGPDYTIEAYKGMEPSCTTNGYGRRICACGAVLGAESIPAQHQWKEPEENDLDPTCSKPGKRTLTCERCGKTQSEEVPATGIHVWVDKVEPANCAHGNITTSKCKWCDKINPMKPSPVDDDKIGPHTFDLDGEYEIKAGADGKTPEDSCTVSATLVFTCTVCGKETFELTREAQTTHKAPRRIRKDATCTQPESWIDFCDACGWTNATPVQNGKPAQHPDTSGSPDWYYPSATSADRHFLGDYTNLNVLITKGYTFTYKDETYCTFECPTCGEELTIEHAESSDKSSKEDCLYQATWEQVSKCKYCGYVMKDNRDASNNKKVGANRGTKGGTIDHHKENGEYKYYYKAVGDSDCVKGGLMRKYCAFCDEQVGGLLRLEPGEHTMKEGKILQKPTCEKTGKQLLVCEICGATAEKELDKVPSVTGQCDWEIIEEKEPTETEDGFRKERCKNCGDEKTTTLKYEDQPAPECKHVEIVRDQMDQSRTAVVTWCMECGEIFSIDPTGSCKDVYVLDKNGEAHYAEHYGYDAEKGGPTGTEKEELPDTEATCTKPKLVNRVKCLVCGQIAEQTVEGSALGHSWEREGFKAPADLNVDDPTTGWVVDEKAEPGKPGSGHYTCTDPNCDDKEHNTRTDTIPALAGPAAITIEVVKMGVLCEEPDDASAFVDIALPGQTYSTTTETFNGFYKVEKDGTTCYIHEDYCRVVG